MDTRLISVWKRGFALLVVIGLAACAPQAKLSSGDAGHGGRSISPTASATADDQLVASRLQARYDDTRATCASNLPAILCSGLLMRATVRGNYDVWNPNPASALKKGVSFSWLRRDVGFSDIVFGYSNGFIFMPALSSSGYTEVEVLCAYAFDADTFNRTGGANDGCAAHKATAGTNPCQAQGIFNAAQWLARFQYVNNRYTQQCAFTLREGTPDAGTVFQAIGAIRAALPASFDLHDEIMLSTWPQNDPNIPLEAFFYLRGQGGQAQAKANQADFQRKTGRHVPVVRITLPSAPGRSAVIDLGP
ncbi:hypothetical protein P3W33_12745 [Luteibacter sp. PPL552]